MKPEFKERIRREYQKMIDAGVDPHVAKKRLLRRRVKVAQVFSFNALKRILFKRSM
jgi:hypothetical protein